MGSRRVALRRTGALGALVTLIAGGLTVLGVAGTAAAAPTQVQQRTSSMVTADSLPTAQVNGVVWTQKVAGNIVYVGGEFTKARPAGSPAGQNEVTRNNLMAYNLTTGELITTFAPSANAQVKTMAVSPDGTRLYIGGSFISIDGVSRYRIAAFNAVTGALITSFAAGVDYTVNAMIATNDVLYVGGAFSTAGGQARSRLAAFSASNGALLGWAPTTDASVQAMVLAPDGSRVIVGGNFANVNGASAKGSASVDAVTGASLPWALNQTVNNSGNTAAILSLTTDGTSIYGGGYKNGGSAVSFEGTFRANPSTGAIEWLNDCHGDTYSVYAGTGAVYQVGHTHYCGNNYGMPQTASWTFNRANAMTFAPMGTLIREPLGYGNFINQPAPAQLSWQPRLDVGTYTGKDQAAWSVTGNGQYVLLGGEFPLVNGKAQQGLARFAVASIAPKAEKPQLVGADFAPTVTSDKSGQVRIAIRANWDRDDRNLTYRFIRNSQSGSPVYTATVASAEWERPMIGYTDTGLTPGQTYNYRVTATDGDGNVVTGDTVSVTVAGSTTALTSYGQVVVNQGASLYWPMNEATGFALRDRAGYQDGIIASGVTKGAAGAITGDTALSFNGSSNGKVYMAGSTLAPDVFTISAWFKTSTTKGGRIIGFSDLQYDNGGHRDRQIYMNNTGKLSFGVYGTSASSVTSANSYNDNVWHQAVASLGPNGMTLYVDGVQVGKRTDVTGGEKYIGFWRVGGDSTSGWSNAGTNANIQAVIDEVSVYPKVLTLSQINAQWTASGRTSTVLAAPTDTYGAEVYDQEPTLYWRLGENAAATTAADSGTSSTPGGYQGTVTKGVAGALPGVSDTAVTFNGSNGFVSSNKSFSNPTNYSVEAWFKSTSTSGGKIIGFGNARTGLSTTYDRHVYLTDAGKLVFGAGAAGNNITTPASYNDGTWHLVTATQGAGGMKLYVDGQLVGSNAATTPTSYTGYWRVGGDRTNGGSTSSYLAGSIDEAAVYSGVLSQAEVTQHWTAGGGTAPNVAPTASFTSGTNFLAASFDASASADPDGSIASYAWNFGDNTTGTGATVSHSYTAAGTYTVTLTVTDNNGATGTTTGTVTVAPKPNGKPTAVFTSDSAAPLQISVNGSGSTDEEGPIASWSWNFGDGGTATGATASHTYDAAGTYTVTLTVTDAGGLTDTTSLPVTVAAANTAPTAAFTSAVNGSVVTVDGSGSSDAEGPIASYAWNFGDGTTATGATASRTYTAAGTYTVTLTVTDGGGLTHSTSAPVTIEPSATIAADAFNRIVASGWGTAETGGAWTVGAGTPAATVASGTANLPVAKGGTRVAALNSVDAGDIDLTFQVALDKAPTGGNTLISTMVRRVGTSDYRLTAVHTQTGTITLQLLRVNAGVSTTLRALAIPGVTHAPGAYLNLRFQVTGTGTVEAKAKAWSAGATEPTAWSITATDTAPTGQPATGGIAVQGYVSGSATNAPIVVSFRDLEAVTPGA
ncbi:PKD domain-containing protein [Nakamurella sp. YIM 132087]|uniref:PKD domain-containing protein n=1 Tax=Nakamurella alba TaxID=2665158 RepID=A0A7K1FF78_9ACTN|nr:PKD domain-containing protein [Nakamurella alba]